MNERALSEHALQAGLRDIRLPAEAAGGMGAELAAAIALAAIAALMIGLIARQFLGRKPRPAPARPNLARRLGELDVLPDAERRIALLHLLKSYDPSQFSALCDGLYRPDGGPDIATLRAALARHA
ncbi:hypothetical protein [Primorskyibacter marinus]|uniref:hypothetical protein n=1 Tax=Primorskyibacter marinus TaxID=1977320 RepID=UPI000E308DEF|nr:hypothetical protein [Primorskyibacter marinus]